MKGNLLVSLATFALVLGGTMALTGCNTVQGAAYGTGRAVESTARGVGQDVHAVTGGHTHAYHRKATTTHKAKHHYGSGKKTVKHTETTTTKTTMNQAAPAETQSSY